MKKHDLQIEGQISLFDFEGKPDYQGSQDENRRYSIEVDFEREINLQKCSCGSEPEKRFISSSEYFVKCPNCNKQTKYFKHMYEAMQSWNKGIIEQVTCAEEYYQETGKKTYWQDSQGKEAYWWRKDCESKEFPPIIKELSERLHKLFENQETYREEYEVWEHVPSLGKRYSIFVRKIISVPREELDKIYEEFKKYNLEIKESFAGWDEENNIKIAITTIQTV